jgi:TctA family transporter
MLLSTVGISAAVPRFTLGSSELMNGLEVIPLMIGLFGVAEVFRALSSGQSLAASAADKDQPASLLTTLLTVWRHKLTVVVSSLTGTVVGALPGAGADIAAWGAYGVAQRTSREPERFGEGIEEGVIAPTSANNAAVGGAWIPALVFGVPGDAVTAIVLPAMMVYNVKPGPRIFIESGDVMQQLFAIALLTQILLLPAGMLGLRAFRLVLSLPRAYILTGVMVFSVVGSFAVRQSMFDVYVMLAAGLLGWFLESRQVPVAPVVLGLILGPIVEDNLRRGMISGGGSFVPFLTRPYCLMMIALLAAGLLAPLAVRRRTRLS